MRRIAGWVLGASLIAPAGARAEQQTLAQDLKRLTIEELAEIDITSASRRAERLADVPAAVAIIRDEDIRRAGVTTLAEAMRLAGVLDVARIRGNSWAVSARGFTITTANKLLVLVDGRTIYSPLFAGTFWDAQDLVLADIDRIEVVRGPGGSTWGANAVNGVINIITKPAAATRGTFVSAGGGSPDWFAGAVRHGGRLGAGGSYRVYGTYRARAPVFLASGASSEDSQQFGQGGLRLESGLSGASQWFVQGDVYRGVEGLLSRDDDADIAGGNVMARWTRRFSRGEFQGQVYYDRTLRHVPQQFEERRNTFDVEALHRLRYGARHEFVAGGNVRVTHGRDRGSAGFRFVPEERTTTLLSVILQDDIVLTPDRLFLRLGSKFERNDYTGLEVQPTARVRVSMGPRQTAWAAVSRAVRLPSRFDTDLRLVNPLTGAVTVTGREDFDSESVVAYETGYRVRPNARLAFDISVFANRYDDLRSLEPPTRPGVPAVLGNLQNAKTAGVELIAVVQPHDRWRVRDVRMAAQRVQPRSRQPRSVRGSQRGQRSVAPVLDPVLHRSAARVPDRRAGAGRRPQALAGRRSVRRSRSSGGLDGPSRLGSVARRPEPAARAAFRAVRPERAALCGAARLARAIRMALLTAARFAVVAALVAAGLAVPAAQSSGSIEDDVKAAYLFNFTKFVEWPAGAFTGTSDPLNVCVTGDAAVLRAVEQAIAGERVEGRPLKLVAPPPPDTAGCHILYLGRGAADRARLVAAAVKRPVLVVGDSPQLLQQGAAIAFLIEERRVRFDIDPAAVSRAGIKVSSKLLRVARHVVERSDPR